MHLWIIRHADANPAARGADDFSRTLSQRGRDDADRVARWFRDDRHALDAIVTSDAPRARETASLLARGVGIDLREVKLDHRLYGASADAIVEVIRETPIALRSLAIVGHNPGVSATVRLLTHDRTSPPLPTLGVVRLDIDRAWSDLEEGCASLAFYADPATVG